MPTGYTRDKSFLAMVVDIVRELKQQNSRLVYGRHGAVTHWSGVAPRLGGGLASFLCAPLCSPSL